MADVDVMIDMCLAFSDFAKENVTVGLSDGKLRVTGSKAACERLEKIVYPGTIETDENGIFSVVYDVSRR